MKKINVIIPLILLITLSLLIIPKKHYAAQNINNTGDINGDKIVDSRDTLKILKHIAASTIPSINKKHPDWILIDDKFKAGDINNDGVIDSRDTLKQLEYIAASTIPKIATKHPEWKNNMNREESGIELNETSVTISIGQVYKIIATNIPTNIENNTIKWISSDTKVATADGLGNVEGKGEGITIITATSSIGKEATCRITVKPTEEKSKEVTSIVLKEKDSTIVAGKTLQLHATITPVNATNKTITWASSDSSIATVSNSGLVKGIKDGKATITATTSNGKVAKCTIKVTKYQTINLQHAIKVSAEPHAKDHENLPWHGSTVGKHAGMIGAYVEAINILNEKNYRLKEVYKKLISAHPKQKTKNEPVYENKDINDYYKIKVSRASASVKEIKKALEQGKLVAEIVNTTKWRDEKGKLFGKTGRHTGLIFYYDGKYYHMKTSVKKNAIYTESQLKEWLGNTKTKLVIYSRK